MAITIAQARELAGTRGRVYDPHGTTLGQIRTLLIEEDTHRPTWVVVDPAEPGLAPFYLPLVAADVNGTDITVPYASQTVRVAPAVADPAAGMTAEEEQTLTAYYNAPPIAVAPSPEGAAAPSSTRPRTTPAGTTNASQDVVVTRSEEQLRVTTFVRPRERIRLVKHIVTETVTQTFEVRREELRIERGPWTEDEQRSTSASTRLGSQTVAFDQDDVDVVLHEERLVVGVEVVPVERVRLRIHTATDAVAVEDTVEVEHVDLEAAPITGGPQK